MKINLFLILLMFVPIYVYPQWNSDPSVNTVAAGISENRTCPLICTAKDGAFYVSNWQYVTDTNVNYHLNLQYIDRDGFVNWGGNGIKISTRKCREWLGHYALVTDTSGNAVVAFEDLRADSGYSHVVVTAYDKFHNALWDTSGVRIDFGNHSAYSPAAAVTRKNNIIVAWYNVILEDSDKTYILVQKLSPSGQILWSEPKVISNGDSTTMFPVIVPVGEDDYILIWLHKYFKADHLGGMWYTSIYAQRFGPAGEPVWPDYKKVCEHGDSAWVMPQFMLLNPIRDENDGFYLVWYDDRYQIHTSNVYLQHIDSAGNMQWPQNGIAVSSHNEGYDRVEPMMTYDASLQEVTVLWNEARAIGIYDGFGLVGQRFSPAGSLLWSDTGRILNGFDTDTAYYLRYVGQMPDHDVFFQYIRESFMVVSGDTLFFDKIVAGRINQTGSDVWTPGRRIMAATSGPKYYITTALSTENMYATSWMENRNDPYEGIGKIYIQNITDFGNLGPLSITDQSLLEAGAVLFPNPSSGQSAVQFPEMINGKIYIKIYDSSGRQIKNTTENGTGHDSMIFIDSIDLLPGFYLVNIDAAGVTYKFKWTLL